MAKTIFVAHVFTLLFLCSFGVVFMLCHTDRLLENFATPFPTVNVAGEDFEGTWWTAVFYGFSSAMLGVSGFETSSQFVEEQQPGVFEKTLKNMWTGVMVFNPLLSLISFSALPLETIVDNKDTVLAGTAEVIGHWVKRKLLVYLRAM